jgi:hypothetical protein
MTEAKLGWKDELELVVQKDQEFFLANPTQEYYVRPITQAELSEAHAQRKFPPANSLVLVGELEPGVRIRAPFAEEEGIPSDEFAEMKKEIQQRKNKYKKRPKHKGFKSLLEESRS